LNRLVGSIMAQLTLRSQAHMRNAVVAAVVLVIGTWLAVAAVTRGGDKLAQAETASQGRSEGAAYFPTPQQWESWGTAPVSDVVFRTEHLTEGKITVDEDRATLVYSPYAGRVVKLFAKPGDQVIAGQPLFGVESPDMVQAQNDFITAIAGLNKAQAALNLAKIIEQQNKTLFETKAGPLRDLQQAQATLLATQNDLHAAKISLEAVRNRLRILGKTDEEIDKFSETGIISTQVTIYSPISGTVVQRKVGPGQYVNTTSNSAAANDATFIIGDLSTVWLVAYVRESEAPNVRVGQAIHFTVMAFPDRVFPANISYVATSLDSATRRLLVRAVINNKEGVLRPEMFARVTILTGEGESSPAVPREALIYDGKAAHVWVVRADRSLERRNVQTGLSNGAMIQVLNGLQVGDSVVSKGSLFVDRAAAGS